MKYLRKLNLKRIEKINNKELWRCDFNLHSEKWIKKILSNRNDISKIYFKYPIMDTKIQKKIPQILMFGLCLVNLVVTK